MIARIYECAVKARILSPTPCQNDRPERSREQFNRGLKRRRGSSARREGVEHEEDDEMSDTPIVPQPARQIGVMARYLVVEARPPEARPPWALNQDENDIFTRVRPLEEHPFAYKENLVYLLLRDPYFNTEVLTALIERKYIIREDLQDLSRNVGDVLVTEARGRKLFGIVIKTHIDSKVVRPDITKCIQTLKQLFIKFGIKSVGIARDLDILSATEWEFLVEKVNKLFGKMTISVVFFKNALPIPPVHERFWLTQEFHCSAISGHKGVTKTYNRLAREYYWRNMQSDV